jgi:hypothetical protein
MVLPSGDHDGERSITRGEFVMLRGSPFSAGTVTISPRASNSARVAVGDRCAPVRLRLTFTSRSRTSGRSPAIRTGTGFIVADLRSNNARPPNCSTTIASGPAPADLKSSPPFLTSSFTWRVRVSYENSVTGPLRSLRK